MIDFLISKILRDPEAQLHEDTPLVSSGLVDSFALVEVLTELERVTNLRIPSGRVSPQDLDTVRKMLLIAARWGKPRN
jgi:acyl carrier protein